MYRNLLLVLSLLFVQFSQADGGENVQEEVQTSIKKQLRNLDPDIPITMIKKSPIEGLFTVVLQGGRVFYTTRDGKYLVKGEMLEINKSSVLNLTEEILSKERAKMLSQIKLEDMIIFPPKGKTKGVMYAFTDVDCGYCRKLHREGPRLSELGIELRYLAYPNLGYQGKNAPGYKKIVSAWCAKDRQTAMTELKSGRQIKAAKCNNPVDAHIQLGNSLGVGGTPAIFLEDGRSIPGYKPADDIALIMGIATQ